MRLSEIVFLIARVFAVGFLVWTLRGQRYGYFVILVIGFIISKLLNMSRLAWILGSIAVLYNPLFPFNFNKSTWKIINIIVCVIVLASLLFIAK